MPRGGFGTVCSSLLALPRAGRRSWLFAAGPPDVAPFLAVSLTACQHGGSSRPLLYRDSALPRRGS